MQSHNYRATLLEAINLFLENTPQSLRQAHLLIKVGKRSISSTSVNFVIWYTFFNELTDIDYFENREFLLERRQDLLGLSRHYFQAYVGHDYILASSPEELQVFNYLYAAVNWLSSLQAAQHEDDDHYAEIQSTLRSYHSIFPFVDDAYSERISLFILRMVSAIVENVVIPSMAFADYSHLVPNPYEINGVRDENEYPSLSRDFAWAINALQSLQGQSWLSFQWQFLPASLTLIVR